MDRFKFRVWDKKIKKMNECYFSSFDFIQKDIKDDNDKIMTPCRHRNCIKKDDKDIVLMQSTGLKDKNGKLVYGKHYLLYADLIFKVDFDKENARFTFSLWMIDDEFDKEEAKFYITEHTNIKEFLENSEIIGNIYENPELLKPKQDLPI